MIIDDFLTAAEIVELVAAGRDLALKAVEQQTERRTFASIKPNSSASDAFLIESGDMVRCFYEPNALDADGQLLVDAQHAVQKIGHALHIEHDIFRRLTCSERVMEVCWQLGFRRPAVPQSALVYHNPGVGSVSEAAHQDASHLHTQPQSTVSFWIPLVDATVQNGCLKLIKGSHLAGLHQRYVRSSTDGEDETTKAAGARLAYDRAAPIYPASAFAAVPVPKGALVLIHGQTVHRCEPNRSADNRSAYTFQVIETDGVTYATDNWLQPTAAKAFPVLYTKAAP